MVRRVKSSSKPKRKPRKAAPAKPKGPGRGGARVGAGRKRDRLPQVVVERLGLPPVEPAALELWARRVLAELLVLQITGEVSVDLAASIRASIGEIRRGLPSVPAKPVSDDDDDDDLEEDDGPELEDADDDALRVE